MKDNKFFNFSWYHREEFQVLIILIGLIVFFARSFWVILTLTTAIIIIILLLYLIRIIESYCEKKNYLTFLVSKYKKLKSTLHGHSVTRSRIAMSLLAAWVLGVLLHHRIYLSQLSSFYKTPTDIYWILFLGWYFIVCTISASYLLWLWNSWTQDETKHIPILDGLVASLFFYHGLPKKNRVITYVAAFLLGGLPSYFALRLTPETPHGYEIACFLIIPLIGFVLGGAFYAMVQLRKISNSQQN